MILHTSDARIFRDCRRKWEWTSRQRQNLEPIAPDLKFWLGTACHFALEHYYGKSDRDAVASLAEFDNWTVTEITRIRHEYDLTEEQKTRLEETRELGLGMLRHYFEWAPEVDDFEVLSTEQEFEVPLIIDGNEIPGVRLAGRLDGVIRFPATKDIYVFEHKTAISIQPENLVLDEQAGSYVYAAEQLYGYEVKGILYNFLRKKVPTVPQKLVAGGLSKNKSIDTTYSIYLRTIEQCELDPNDYTDFLEMLAQRPNAFFHRELVIRTRAEIRDLVTRFYWVAREMSEKPVLYPSPDGLKCKMCPFVQICVAMANGADWQFLLKSKYQPRPKERAAVLVEDYDLPP
jgi:hypothetical protein